MKKAFSKILAVGLLALFVMPAFAEKFGDFEYRLLYVGEVTIQKYTGSDKNVNIPETIDGKKVTAIGEKAFYGCKSLTSVTIPWTVSAIGDKAFANCTSLESVPEVFGYIRDEAFYGCKSLTSVTIKSTYFRDQHQDVYVGVSAFENCTSLKSVFFTSGADTVRERAFFNCHPDLVITGTGGQEWKYAEKNGIKYRMVQ